MKNAMALTWPACWPLLPRLRRRAGRSDGLRPPGRQGQRIRRRQHFRTQAFKVRLVNAARARSA
ncbi:hypothetical protein P4131_29580 [Pseudomonas aeruginosa]|nr:hypothetical protein [Pseudomonas aeruginosa]